MSDNPPEIDKRQSLPAAAEIKQEITNAAQGNAEQERSFLEIFRQRSIEGERAYVHIRGLSEHYWHKSFWAKFIAVLMGFMVVFQSFLLCMVGSGIWNFEKYVWLLPALLVQNLAQIVGLAVFEGAF
jgi:hypothetical protein